MDFAFIFVYLGFLWDLVLHTVTLPDTKWMKYHNKLFTLLDTLASGKRISCKDTMSINRTLSHIVFIIPHGRAYLANLLSFIAEFPSIHVSHFPHTSVVSDLKWWLDVLNHTPPPCSHTLWGDLHDIDLWVDASTDWGIGLVIGDKWNAWTLCDGWKGQGRDIGWLKAITVESTMRTLLDLGWHNAAMLIHSDNQGVIGAFQHGRSCNFQVNLCIHRVKSIAMATNVSHILTYVESERNRADKTSHSEVRPSVPPFKLPGELQAYITDYV
jgi:hypothetical protein